MSATLITKPRHVLAVTDFSDTADEALRQAHGYASMAGARLTVLHVVPDALPASPLPDGSAQGINLEVELETRALDMLVARVEQATGRSSSEVDLVVRTGHADVAVVRFAEENEVDVVVAGAAGRTGLARLLLGGTAERLVRHAHCSVLVARRSPPADRVLVATDLRDAALPVIEWAKREAEWRHAKLDLVHVMDLSALGWAAATTPLGSSPVGIPPKQLAELRELAKNTLSALGGPGAGIHVEEGSPKRNIVSLAESLPAGLVIVGAHERTGLGRMTLGSVAEAVVRAAPCSVLVLRSIASGARTSPE